jgi:hypothetical protein
MFYFFTAVHDSVLWYLNVRKYKTNDTPNMVNILIERFNYQYLNVVLVNKYIY